MNHRSIAVVAISWGLLASAPAFAQRIFTCVDANGRKLTSDRPIAECNDRDQKELTTTGTVKRILKPVMTAQEQRDFDAKKKAEAEEKSRQDEEKRKDRALLTRYPSRAVHDKERAEALAQVDEVMKAATRRVGELADQRKQINEELEFYKKDPKKIPFPLKRQVDDNDNSVEVQKRFIMSQEDEKKRVNKRFDEELVKLKSLWTMAGLPADDGGKASASNSAASKPKK
jgi:hypothetical protein